MTGGSTVTRGERPSHFWRGHSSGTGGTSGFGLIVATIAAIYVLLIYSNVVELLPRVAVIGPAAARLTIYSVFVIGIVATAAYAVLLQPRSRWLLFFLVYAFVLALVMLLHATVMGDGIGLATKSFVAGIFEIIGFGFLLGLRPARAVVVTATALVLIVTTVFCAVDLMIIRVFSTIPGRGAGFYFNPNVAALALLLGSLGIMRTLRPLWRLPLVAVVAVGLLATLSRSGLLIGVLVALVFAKPIFADIGKNIRAYRAGGWLAAAILVVGVGYLTVAYYFGPSYLFASSVRSARERIIGSPIASVEKAKGNRSVRVAPSKKSTAGDVGGPPGCDSWTAVLRGLRWAQQCAWLKPGYIDREGRYNSGATRILLGLRGLAAFLDAPWLGTGLDHAFSLRPHNSYLLFGIAYGVLGLLFVPVFCIFVWWRMGIWTGLPLVIFVILAGIFSHDIFLSRDLVAGLAIAMSSDDRAWQG